MEIYQIENVIQFNFFSWDQLTKLTKPIFDSFKTQLSIFALVILKYLLSIHRIAKSQSIIWIDCNSNTETFSNVYRAGHSSGLSENRLLDWKILNSIFEIDPIKGLTGSIGLSLVTWLLLFLSADLPLVDLIDPLWLPRNDSFRRVPPPSDFGDPSASGFERNVDDDSSGAIFLRQICVSIRIRETGSGAAFTTLYFLRNLWTGPVSWSVTLH